MVDFTGRVAVGLVKVLSRTFDGGVNSWVVNGVLCSQIVSSCWVILIYIQCM